MKDKNHAATNDVSSKPSSTNEVRLKAIPSSGWTTGYNYIIDNGVPISRSFVYEYLIDHARDKLVGPANNSRSLKMGYNLFASGHVQSIYMAKNTSCCFYKAVVLPTMKKDKCYTVLCAISFSTKKIC